MISKEQELKIRQLHYRDHWRIGTISANLDLHRDTVIRVLGLDRKKKGTPRVRIREIDQHRAFIEQVLKEYPKLRSTRLLEMVRGQGYTGSIYPVRRMKRVILPTLRKAFLDLHFGPGEMAQVDWAHFGHLQYGKHRRPLNAFVMVLAHSRMIYARMFHDMKSGRVLEGHVLAFDSFGGVPKTVLFDNMKTAVIENLGVGIRFQSALLELASHYRFMPRACNPRSGWEKGRVERAIRYIRDSFFGARKFESIEDLNDQLADWLRTTAAQRDWTEDRTRKVHEVFCDENLMDLPGDAFDPYEELCLKSDKKAMIAFDCNRYPIDPEYVGQILTLRASHDVVNIYDKEQRIHCYPRCWSRGVKVILPGHQERIAEARKIKSHNAGRHILERSLDSGSELLKLWAELGDNLQQSAREVLRLIKLYGADDVNAAARMAIENQTPRSCSIGYILTNENDRPLENKNLHLKGEIADIEIKPTPLDTYDELYNP